MKKNIIGKKFKVITHESGNIIIIDAKVIDKMKSLNGTTLYVMEQLITGIIYFVYPEKLKERIKSKKKLNEL